MLVVPTARLERAGKPLLKRPRLPIAPRGEDGGYSRRLARTSGFEPLASAVGGPRSGPAELRALRVLAKRLDAGAAGIEPARRHRCRHIRFQNGAFGPLRHAPMESALTAKLFDGGASGIRTHVPSARTTIRFPTDALEPLGHRAWVCGGHGGTRTRASPAYEAGALPT